MSEPGTLPASPGGTPGGGQRGYRSPLREERAADTRRRIVTSARSLFTDRGFTGTTVCAIAQDAGVSQPTVYAVFGSKGAIMRALLSQLEDDADAIGWSARIDAEPDPRKKLEAFARWSRELFSTGRQVIAAALDAGSEPTVVELKDQGDRNRREWLGRVVSALAAADALRPGLSEQEALDRAWMLSGPELYFRASDGCSWSDQAYQRWLTTLLQDQLLLHPREDAGAADTQGTGGHR